MNPPIPPAVHVCQRHTVSERGNRAIWRSPSRPQCCRSASLAWKKDFMVMDPRPEFGLGREDEMVSAGRPLVLD